MPECTNTGEVITSDDLTNAYIHMCAHTNIQTMEWNYVVNKKSEVVPKTIVLTSAHSLSGAILISICICFVVKDDHLFNYKEQNGMNDVV